VPIESTNFFDNEPGPKIFLIEQSSINFSTNVAVPTYADSRASNKVTTKRKILPSGWV